MFYLILVCSTVSLAVLFTFMLAVIRTANSMFEPINNWKIRLFKRCAPIVAVLLIISLWCTLLAGALKLFYPSVTLM